jgi:ferredoxin
MLEAEVKFERENREGLVAVGTYLIDAARRFGIRFDDVCLPADGLHYCSLAVSSGSELLSHETRLETEYFATNDRMTNERLACQVKIEKPGEIVIMTKEKEQESKGESETAADKSEEYRKAFAEMPLEKKIANLVQLESIALGETVSFIINSPFKIADKVVEVMAEFGFKKEEREKEAARPAEHKTQASNGDPKVKTKKPKESTDSV